LLLTIASLFFTAPSAPPLSPLSLHDALPIFATSQVGSSAYVILGNGDGTFQSTDSYGVGNVPVDVAVGDLNSDGHVDFVTANGRSEEHTSELQSRENLVCRLLLEKKKNAMDR